jgi:hypothetical protein
LGHREIGHVHGDSLVDIPFPLHVRDELVKGGAAEPHHVLPKSGWVSVYLRTLVMSLGPFNSCAGPTRLRSRQGHGVRSPCNCAH